MKMSNRSAALISAAVLLLGGCGANGSEIAESSAEVQSAAAVDAAQLLDGINEEKLDGKLFSGEEKFDSNAAKFYGTDSIEDGGILYNTEGCYADEVSAVRFSEGTDGAALLKTRLEDRTATFRDYRPEELDKLKKARVISVGGYDILIISDNADGIEKQLRESLG